MSDTKRFVVLEAQHQADQLMDFVEYLTLSQPALGLKAITRRESSNIIYCLVRDMVDENLAHKLVDETSMEIIAGILFGVPKNTLTKEMTTRLEVITQSQLWHSIRINLGKQIDTHIPKNSWTDWTVIKSSNLIGLAEGEDHRISEFHKADKALSVDDEAVVTLNCSNPINYLHNEFFKRYGVQFNQLKNSLTDPEFQIALHYRKLMMAFVNDPSEYIIGLFLDTLVMVHPQIEIGKNAFKRNLFIERALGIYDIETFQRTVVSKLILAFGMNWFTHEVKKDQNYYVEFYKGTNIVAVFHKEFTTHTEKYEAELVNAFHRGDFLPENERILAERLAIENANQVLRLNPA